MVPGIYFPRHDGCGVHDFLNIVKEKKSATIQTNYAHKKHLFILGKRSILGYFMFIFSVGFLSPSAIYGIVWLVIYFSTLRLLFGLIPAMLGFLIIVSYLCRKRASNKFRLLRSSLQMIFSLRAPVLHLRIVFEWVLITTQPVTAFSLK
jgi:hypothetical protein